MQVSVKNITAIFIDKGKPYKVYIYKGEKQYQVLTRIAKPTEKSLREICESYCEE